MALGISSGSADAATTARSGSSDKSISINLETMHLWSTAVAKEIQSRVSMDTLRPLPSFLGVDPSNSSSCLLSAGAFTPPVQKLDKTTVEKVTSRVKLNAAYFLTNYVLLAIMVAVVVALMHPGMICFVALCWSLWSLHHFLISNQLVMFGINVHTLLSIQQRFYILFTLTTLVVVWKCLLPSIYFCSISVLMILSHAFLRDPKHTENSARSNIISGEQQQHHPHHHDSDDSYNNVEGGSAGSDSSSSDEVLVERPSKK